MKSTADRSFPAVEPAPSHGAVPEGGSAARGGRGACSGGFAVSCVPPVDQVSGEQLASEIVEAARAAGRSLHAFLSPLHTGLHGGQYVRQLRLVKKPHARTVGRIRRLIAGEIEVPPPTVEVAGGTPGSRNRMMMQAALESRTEIREREDDRRRASELGKALRAPGETLAEAVKRESLEAAERRTLARAAGGGVEPIDMKRIPHHPKARRFEPLPADIWARLRELAAEQGEEPMKLLPLVVERGIEALRSAA